MVAHGKPPGQWAVPQPTTIVPELQTNHYSSFQFNGATWQQTLLTPVHPNRPEGADNWNDAAEELFKQMGADLKLRDAAISNAWHKVNANKEQSIGWQHVFHFRASGEDQVDMAKGFRGHVTECSKSLNGSHVIQAIISHFPVDSAILSFVIDELLETAADVAENQVGCRAICRLIENMPSQGTKIPELLDRIVQGFRDVDLHAPTKHGAPHHVLKLILEHGKPDHKLKVVSLLKGHWVGLTTHKQGSVTVEAALQHLAVQESIDVYEEIRKFETNWQNLSKHRCGRYVWRALQEFEARNDVNDVFRNRQYTCESIKLESEHGSTASTASEDLSDSEVSDLHSEYHPSAVGNQCSTMHMGPIGISQFPPPPNTWGQAPWAVPMFCPSMARPLQYSPCPPGTQPYYPGAVYKNSC